MYDRFPSIASGSADECLTGWSAVAQNLSSRVGASGVLAIESYPAVNLNEIENALRPFFPSARFLRTERFLRPPSVINEMVEPTLGDDPVFGQMNCIAIEDWEQPRHGNRIGWLAGLAMAASCVVISLARVCLMTLSISGFTSSNGRTCAFSRSVT